MPLIYYKLPCKNKLAKPAVTGQHKHTLIQQPNNVKSQMRFSHRGKMQRKYKSTEIFNIWNVTSDQHVCSNIKVCLQLPYKPGLEKKRLKWNTWQSFQWGSQVSVQQLSLESHKSSNMSCFRNVKEHERWPNMNMIMNMQGSSQFNCKTHITYNLLPHTAARTSQTYRKPVSTSLPCQHGLVRSTNQPDKSL